MGSGTAETAPKAEGNSFRTHEGKIHFMPNKVEAGVQVLCTVLSLLGLFFIVLKGTKESDAGNPRFDDYRSIGYIFASGSFLCIALLFNAGAHLPQMTPLLMGMGYFYFGHSISRIDTWRKSKEDGVVFEDYDTIMAGSIISLIATAVASIFEISLPGSGKGRSSGCGAAEAAAIVFMLVGFGGLCVLWAKNDTSNGDGNVLKYQELQQLSIEAIITLMFLADSLMHFDAQITSGAILLGTLTGCNLFIVGVEYEQIQEPTDDERIARQGALVCSVAMGVLTVVAVLATALGRNSHESERRSAFRS